MSRTPVDEPGRPLQMGSPRCSVFSRGEAFYEADVFLLLRVPQTLLISMAMVAPARADDPASPASDSPAVSAIGYVDAGLSASFR